jgi:hypothetical protein
VSRAITLAVTGITLAALAMVALGAGGELASGRAPAGIVVEHGRLSGWLDRVSLRQALEAVADAGDLDVVGGDVLEGEVTLAFERVLLEEGLARLLTGHNYVLLYEGPSGATTLRGIRILPGFPPVPRQPPLAATPITPAPEAGNGIAEASAEKDPVRQRGQFEALLRHDPDPSVRGAALEALAGLDLTPPASVVESAADDPEPSIRMQALELIARRAQGDRRLLGALTRAAHADPDPAIREVAAALLGPSPSQE